MLPREGAEPSPPLNPPLAGLPPVNAPLTVLATGLLGMLPLFILLPDTSCAVLGVPLDGLPDAPPDGLFSARISGKPTTATDDSARLPPDTEIPCPITFPIGILPPVPPTGALPPILPPVPVLLFGLLPPEPVPFVPVPPVRLLCELLVFSRLVLPAVRMVRLSLCS